MRSIPAMTNVAIDGLVRQGETDYGIGQLGLLPLWKDPLEMKRGTPMILCLGHFIFKPAG
ncbi:MAG: hypothetical protein BBJ60_00240 [Desulfobacterales bacterium S7086C20]|nr:MAG: hypothetical protein BBJ60_00240 [Desulfobacterales bacterium S7086C20]